MFERWLEVFGSDEFNLTATEIADIYWLALIQHRFGVEPPPQSTPSTGSSTSVPQGTLGHPVNDPKNLPDLPASPYPYRPPPSTGGLFTRENSAVPRTDSKLLRVPTARAFRDSLSLARALRPLMQQRVVGEGLELDEPATVYKIAEERVWWPVTQPVTETWLELALVVDESASMLIWRRTIQELNGFFKHYGFFRDVRLWGLIDKTAFHQRSSSASTTKTGVETSTLDAEAAPAQPEICLRANPFSRFHTQDLRRPESLIDPNGRRLILIVTDCVDPLWQTPQLLSTLKLWSDKGPTTILQMMPEWLWPRTNLRQTTSVSFQSQASGSANQALEVVLASTAYYRRSKAEKNTDIKIPIITLESDRVYLWTRMLTAQGAHRAPGAIFNPRAQRMTAVVQQRQQQKTPSTSTGTFKAQTFRGGASPVARRLASLLAASPTITLPIIRMVQETSLPQSKEIHVAEVLLGGILHPKQPPSLDTHPDDVQYQFVDSEIRAALLAEAPVSDTTAVLSRYIEEHFNKSLYDFILELRQLIRAEGGSEDELKPIATIAAEVLQYRGSEYADFVREVNDRFGQLRGSDRGQPPPHDLPAFEPFNFIDAQLVDEDEPQALFPPPLQAEDFTIITFEAQQEAEANEELEPFEFTVAILERQDPRQQQQRQQQEQTTEWEIFRQQQRAYRFIEHLPGYDPLGMVAIPAGTFLMGSPENEPERDRKRESPQHEVAIESFFMGRYPVTQAQWRVVAGLPQVRQALKPDPSRFQGNSRPVERVSWYDAVEFCDRLSAHTGRAYRLPTEAEWEYACRAGTVTPFHFGETITSELANYDGNSTYADGPPGERRGETTPVNHFDIANAFGLCDMHGNVWEWCQDHWHSNYDGAPADGSAWLTEDGKASRVRRGGSWYYIPGNCRSAYRDYYLPDIRFNYFGFRVCCSASRKQATAPRT
jgi:formylglycine-generating enzyme required for sulfatase activity